MIPFDLMLVLGLYDQKIPKMQNEECELIIIRLFLKHKGKQHNIFFTHLQGKSDAFRNHNEHKDITLTKLETGKATLNDNG